MILSNYQSQRAKMVETQIINRGITDELLIRALKKVERHRFLDDALWPEAYDDHPLPIGEKQTISQPYIVALMTELLRLRGTERVLEVGTGSGYQAAVLAEIAEQVFSTERIPALAQRARNTLDSLHYTNIVITVGDGTYGWKEHAPYDAIIVTAAAPTVPKPLLEQLKEGGRLVIPIGDEFAQDLIVHVKHDDGTIGTENYGGCRFVKLIGEHSWKK
jgi:protein-L-isoaspartate(D-aspartate) O-methyltransferase